MLVADAYGARFRLDNRPVTIEGSKLKFDNFSVYTRGSNPFALTGTVDFSNLTNTLLDLRMVARNYELINAPRQKNSVVFGKVYVDIFSTLKGDMNNLKMRGNINVQGNTDVTYILKDSPLTVEDRLSLCGLPRHDDRADSRAAGLYGWRSGHADDPSDR